MKFRIRADGANRVAAIYQQTAQDFPDIIDKRVDEAAEFMTEKIYKSKKVAPSDTGHLRRGIRWFKTGQLTINIVGSALDPETGFNYFPITRFGHQTHLIVPVNQRVLQQGEKRILHWETNEGAEVYSAWSRGFHPLSDWTEKGTPLAREVVRRTGLLITRDISARLGHS